jgi:hypothetical protein
MRMATGEAVQARPCGRTRSGKAGDKKRAEQLSPEGETLHSPDCYDILLALVVRPSLTQDEDWMKPNSASYGKNQD